MVFLFTISAYLLLSARASDRFKRNVTETASVCAAALLLVLYAFAYAGHLQLVGAASLIYIGYVSADLFYKKEAWKIPGYLRNIFSPEMLMFVAAVLFVGFMTGDRVFTWWDDINYWSSDAKQLFFMGGFPGKYGNASPEFGDYPPVTSLAKWLFLQLSPAEYKESLQFTGYFALNAVFLLPLLSKVKEASAKLSKAAGLFLSVLMFAVLMLFSGVFNGMIYYGTPADITMGIVYGALLLAIFDREGTDRAYYYMRIALYVSVLLLTKSVGIEWALFALVFYIIVAKKEKGIFFAGAFGAAVYGSWLLLCLLNRRVAKLTGAGIRMATSGNFTAPDNTFDKMKYFIEAFLFWPMHGDRNITLDISAGCAIVLIFAAIIALGARKLITGKEMRKLLIFSAVTGAIAYGIIFLAHISIFGTEDQYLDAYAMSLSIARYCAPFTLGTAYLLFGISFERGFEKGTSSIMAVAGIWAAFIFLTADYSGVYTHLFDYRNSLQEDTDYVYYMVTDEGRSIAASVRGRQYWGKRILIFRDPENNSYVHNAYISKEACPAALVYDVWSSDDDKDSIIRKMKESHAEYFYVEDPRKEADNLFGEILKDGEYKAGQVYSVNGVNY
ncbi:hypothetical protein [Butyrivibrio sp. FCS014]|uniref:hypothetical protein n=1 Tax=Butyrivibrio sp. FCS014 TaxID=1408304 RepID=UPI0004635B4B|nr:hypothetical protein [Butyrivibrio sp. FCS014]